MSQLLEEMKSIFSNMDPEELVNDINKICPPNPSGGLLVSDALKILEQNDYISDYFYFIDEDKVVPNYANKEALAFVMKQQTQDDIVANDEDYALAA
jgi:hypothetical protein